MKSAIIFIGPVGSGKGTQSIILAEELGLYHFETAKVVEEKFAAADPSDELMNRLKRDFDSGILLDPAYIAQWVSEKVKELAGGGVGIVSSSSPRTLYESQVLLPLLSELYGKENVVIVHLDISEEVSIYRNSHRRLCKASRHPIPNLPEFKDIKECPYDGSEIFRRGSIDTPEVIKVRIKEYKERTLPVLDYARSIGIRVCGPVDGNKSISDVHKDVKKCLERI